jgi:hypothetical protein
MEGGIGRDEGGREEEEKKPSTKSTNQNKSKQSPHIRLGGDDDPRSRPVSHAMSRGPVT